MVEWFKDFGGLTVKGDKFTGWKGAEFIRNNFKSTAKHKNGIAKDTMYWEYKAPNIWAGQDDLKAAKAMIAKHNIASKLVQDDEALVSKAKFDTVLIAEIEAAIERAEERVA